MASRDYRTEFPDFDYELPSIEGFVDVSWHNDACPSLWNEALRLRIFCDYRDPDKRMYEPSEVAAMFSLEWTDSHGAGVAYGDTDAPKWATADDLPSTDDWNEIVAAVNRIAEWPQPARNNELRTLANSRGYVFDDLGTKGRSAWVKQGVEIHAADGKSAYPSLENESAGWFVSEKGAEPGAEASHMQSFEDALDCADDLAERLAAAPRP